MIEGAAIPISTAVHFVLDSSVALAWFFADEADPYADAIAHRFPAISAHVPTIWPLEVANAILMGERRKRSTAEQAARWTDYLRSLPITIDAETSRRAWSGVLDVGRAHNLSAYDAAYLELAVRRGFGLATLDDKLRAAAIAVGVPLFTV